MVLVMVWPPHDLQLATASNLTDPDPDPVMMHPASSPGKVAEVAVDSAELTAVAALVSDTFVIIITIYYCKYYNNNSNKCQIIYFKEPNKMMTTNSQC